MNNDERTALYAAIATLVRRQRWAALATVDDTGKPHASMVAYAPEATLDGLLLHLSRLAKHTRYLLQAGQAALVISAPDTGAGDDPQTLPRLSLQGHVTVLPHDHAEYDAARACYLARLPAAHARFEFADFMLLRFEPDQARYVGGFAQAHSLSRAGWLALGAQSGLSA